MNELEKILRGPSVYEDFLDTLRATDWPDAEHGLLAAVLENGVICYTGVIGQSPSMRRWIAEGAKEWIEASADTPWPFSFENIVAACLPNVGVETFRLRVLAQRRPGLAPDYAGYRGGHRRSRDTRRSLITARRPRGRPRIGGTMPAMRFTFDEPAWPDLVGRADVVSLMGADAPIIEVVGLRAGMESGKPSVGLRFDLPSGRSFITETSLALFLTAADALKARLGDPRT